MDTDAPPQPHTRTHELTLAELLEAVGDALQAVTPERDPSLADGEPTDWVSRARVLMQELHDSGVAVNDRATITRLDESMRNTAYAAGYADATRREHPRGGKRYVLPEFRPEDEGGSLAVLREQAAYASGFVAGINDGRRRWRTTAFFALGCTVVCVATLYVALIGLWF